MRVFSQPFRPYHVRLNSLLPAVLTGPFRANENIISVIVFCVKPVINAIRVKASSSDLLCEI